MRIALRTSGGRGEYELAGRHGNVQASDLFDRVLLFQITPDLVVSGQAAASIQQGKPRIRLQESGASHPYLVLAATLLLPKPKRELRRTGEGTIVLLDGLYSVSGIDVDVVGVGTDSAQLRPTTLWARNVGENIQRIEFARRMALVARLWDVAAHSTSELGDLLRQHKMAVESGDHGAIQRAANRIQNKVGVEGDVLPVLLGSIGVVEDEDLDEGLDVGVAQGAFSEGEEEDDTPPLDAARRQIVQWRKQASRGAQGRRFSVSVKEAYEFRCAFSGVRLPKTGETSSAGVDAAHILPWAHYELDAVSNGVCLSKQCHWAFDAGVVRLDFAPRSREYVLSVPTAVQRAAREVAFDVDTFLALEGPIPKERLPAESSNWPSPKYLEELNQRMFPTS